ncbi:Similar to Ion transport peptide-like (Schistocerca gregaria) [Cotesia congregata]|uniref:Similar to Ion transport peptide-like (Schistocerca gregaria) n=1 Tax=Cotesia congregata TaxID=51543 RepID=A0A8J2MP72_COTCN|nr:Similar to Ion transport peptide-like (Schistocerca gregaria) [Cotesia congregata]
MQKILGKMIQLVIIIWVVVSSCQAADNDKLSQWSFEEIGCEGFYDKKMFESLDNVCQECHGLYQEAIVYNTCRQSCFTSEYFRDCLETLTSHTKNEISAFKIMIKRLQGFE